LAAFGDVSTPRLHVLLAEDNPANRMVARLTLEQAGFDVHEVDNGREALDAAERIPFDVVLMDCRMPVMDGFEATRQIRELDGDRSRVPIIALTASAFKEDRERAQQVGMNDFLAKPFQERELIAKCIALAETKHAAPGIERAPDVSISPPAAPKKAAFAKYSPEFLSSVMEIFLETAPPVFETLLTALRQEDWAEAKGAAHWLQGGATRLVDPDLQRELERIEETCAGNSPAFAAQDLELLQSSFASACTFTEVWLSECRQSQALSNAT